MMTRPFRCVLAVAALSTSLACIAAAPLAQPAADAASGFSERPTGAAVLSQSVADDTLQFFRDKDFKGDMTQFSDVTNQPPWNDHDFESKAKHFSSVRWSLPRGVVVTMFAGQDCQGRCLAIWGSGEIRELSKWKMNDDLSGWSWNGVGGAASASQRVKDGRADRPKYAKVASGVADDSMELFKSREAKGDMTPVAGITDKPANMLHEMPKGTSSLKWKLPPGVVVVFSEKPDGIAPNLAIWGDGQFDTVSLWQMNDKLKYWSWHYVGDR